VSEGGPLPPPPQHLLALPSAALRLLSNCVAPEVSPAELPLLAVPGAACSGDDAAAAAIDAPPPVTWLNVGPDSMLAVQASQPRPVHRSSTERLFLFQFFNGNWGQRGFARDRGCSTCCCPARPQDEIIVEYDVRAMAPIGLVCMDLPDDCSVALVDGEGREVDATNTGGCGGAASGRGMRWGGGQGRQRQCLACWIPAQAGDVRGLRGVCAKRGEPWPAWCHAAAHASCALQAPHPRSPSVRRGPRRLPQTAQLPWRWRCGTPTARCTSASGATTPAPSSRSTRCVSVWLGGMQKLGRRVCLDGGHCVRR
jgi:hypothetical protein